MAISSALSVDPGVIKRLDDVGLRALMQDLFWAESVRCGADRAGVCISHELKAADDGCDGVSPAHSGSTDWFPSVKTCWQLKSGVAGQRARLTGEVTKSVPATYLRD